MTMRDNFILAFILVGTHIAFNLSDEVINDRKEQISKQSTLIKELSANIEIEKKINEDLYQENKILTNEIVLRQDITSLIVDSARSYNLDPILLAKVIKSESNFRPNPKHALPHVIGPAGINTKVWKTLHNPDTYTGNIYAGAEILSHYINDSDSLTLALTRYKGLGKVGYQQAKEIIKEYNNE